MINEYAGDAQDITNRYRALSDDSLLQLCSEGGLTSDAATALQAEMRRRALRTKDVQALKRWQEEQEPKPTPERVFWGYGFSFVGHKYLSTEDERHGVFVATKFVVLRRLSVIPIASYRVKQRNGTFPQIQSRVSLQWDQVWCGIKVPLFASLIGLTGAAVMIYVTDRK